MQKTDRVNISLTPDIRHKAQRLAEEMHNGNVSRLLSFLVDQEDAKQQGKRRLAALLEEGHNSPIVEDASEYFKQARQRISNNVNE